MVRGRATVLAVLLWSVGACATSSAARAAEAPPALEYRLSIPEPASQWVHVELDVKDPRGRFTKLAMPAWTPGSYLIRDFARHVYDVDAVDGSGRKLAVTRLDKQTWTVAHEGRDFTIRYRVWAADRSVRESYVDDDEATLNGTSLFMYLPEQRQRPVRLALQLPEGWSAHTALPRISPTPAFSAADYDQLVDSPLQLGQPASRTFEVEGTRFEYVLAGGEEAGADLDRLVRDAQALVTAFGEAMGGFPTTRYVFLTSITPEGGGGLEHDDSTMMMMRRSAFSTDAGYARAARLAAHEFFHLWNVRRIRDASLVPYDYARENHTSLLWFHEGFTETAETLAMLRAGLVKPSAFVSDVGRSWTRYLRRPGRNYVPISDMSFDAWTRQYQPAGNHPNVLVSYYQKGHLIGMALDLEIRRKAAAKGKTGDLFGVFRRLMRSHGSQGKGITMDDVVQATSAEAGVDMKWFFERYVEGTRELPLPELVEAFGVKVTTHAPWENADGTSTGRDETRDRIARAFTGLDLSGTRVSNVVPDSPAWKAGFMRGDELLAVDEVRISSEAEAEQAFGRAGPGATAKVHLFRDGRLQAIDLPVIENPHRVFVFELLPEDELSDEVRALRRAWLAVDSD